MGFNFEGVAEAAEFAVSAWQHLFAVARRDRKRMSDNQ